MNYRIYYGDNTTFDGYDGLPDHNRDVQFIIQNKKSEGWVSEAGYSVYAQVEGYWQGLEADGLYLWARDRDEEVLNHDGPWTILDLFGLYDRLLDRNDILFGKSMPSDDAYYAIVGRAIEDLRKLKAE